MAKYLVQDSVLAALLVLAVASAGFTPSAAAATGLAALGLPLAGAVLLLTAALLTAVAGAAAKSREAVLLSLLLAAGTGYDLFLLASGGLVAGFNLLGPGSFALLSFAAVHSAFAAAAWAQQRRFGQSLALRSQTGPTAVNGEIMARTILKLSHDIKKPFSLLKIGLRMLNHARSIDETRVTTARLAGEIDDAVARVEHSVQDLLEVATEAELTPRDEALATLLEAALQGISHAHAAPNVTYSYQLSHQKMLKVDGARIKRVLANLVSNAVEAMQGYGDVRIESRDAGGQGPSFVTVIISNTGRPIAPDILPQIFELYFSHAKRGGFGLGLAICKKVIEAHGGTISCVSTEGRTSFTFTLPAADALDDATPKLPARLAKVEAVAPAVKAAFSAPAHPAAKAGDHPLEREIAISVAKLKRKLRVLIVDDEAIYAETINLELATFATIAGLVTIEVSPSVEAALVRLEAGITYDLIIADIDFQKGRSDGFAFVTELIEKGTNATLCIHSNRTVSESLDRFIAIGADFYFAKPMLKVQLLNLLNVSAKRMADVKQAS